MQVFYIYVVCILWLLGNTDALRLHKKQLFVRGQAAATATAAGKLPSLSLRSQSRTILHSRGHHNDKDVPAHLGGKWRKYDIPNKLTVLRVLCIPLFIAAFIANQYALTFWTFVVASVTDFVDGYLARKWQQTSPFGAFLDPVADKLMVSTAMILLCTRYPTVLYSVPIALILCREIAISALREWMGTRGIRDVVQVGKMGKIKTTLQMVAMAILLLVQTMPRHSAALLEGNTAWLQSLATRPRVFTSGMFVLYLSTAATIWSGAEYLLAAWPTLTKPQR